VWAYVGQNPTLVVLAVLALGLLIASRAQPDLTQPVRGVVDDLNSSIMEVAAGPVAEGRRWLEGIGSFFATYDENQKLRDENAKLRLAQSELSELRRKVSRYEQLLKVPTDAPVTGVGGRVMADTSGPFMQTIIVNAGLDQGVLEGQAVVDDRGLLGRVIGTGRRSARVLLLSDLNSRIPVIIEGANLKAILVGDNSLRPTLEYLPPGSTLVAGARVLTTADGKALPPGIAIGTVAKGDVSPRVELFTNEGRADFVRVLQYQAPVDVDAEPENGASEGPPPASLPKPAGTAPQQHRRARPALMRFQQERGQ
jgi:rod shape-determining protein MreC